MNRRKTPVTVFVCAAASASLIPVMAAAQSISPPNRQPVGFIETDFVANQNPLTDANGIVHTPAIVDPNLLNPWGLVASPTSPFWVSDNGSGVSTLYADNTVAMTFINQSISRFTSCGVFEGWLLVEGTDFLGVVL